MHMALNNILIIHYYNAVPDGFQISAQFQRISIRFFFLYDEFRTVGKSNIRIVPGDGVLKLICFCFSIVLRLGVFHHNPVTQNTDHSFKYNQKAFSAGINHARLFEDRKHFRRLFQSVSRFFDNLLPNSNRICIGLGYHPRPFRRHAGNGQNRSFRWLHYSFVGGLYPHCQSLCKIGTVRFFFTRQTFGKSAEQQG